MLNNPEKVCISTWMKDGQWKSSGNEMRENAQEMAEI